MLGPRRRRAMLALSVVGSLLFAGSALAASIGLNFTGSSRSQSGFIPPDTMGAVGGSDIVELINGRYAVYDKNTGLQTAASSLNAFWVNAGVTPAGAFAFDPRVVYDAASSRYFAVAVDNAGGANNYLFAVSNGSSAASGWTGFQIDTDTDNSNWADFPMLGFDASSVYVTGNMFSLGAAPLRTSLLTLPKADLLLGVPSVANRTLFEDIALNASGFTPQPVINYDGGGLPGNAGLLLSAFNTGAGTLKFSSITGTPVAPNLVTAGGFVTVVPAATAGPAAQPGPNPGINTGNTRFSGNAILVNGEVWAVQTIDVGGRAAVRWFRIDPNTNTVLETGVISDPSLEYYFPSIAVNALGDIVIGFSGSDASTAVSTYAVTGVLSLGTTTMGTPFLTHAGSGSYIGLDGIGRNRWGDYSATVPDPSNPLSFWTFQEFSNGFVPGTTFTEWSVRITQIIVPGRVVIPEPTTLALFGLGLLGLGGAVVRRRRKPAAGSSN